MSGELSFACPVHIPIFSILQLSVPELCVTQSDHITFTWNGHCACAVSRDLSPGSKMIHIFEIPELNLVIHFVTFTVLRRILCYRRFYVSPCYRRKIAFSHCKGYKVNCTCAVSRDLCTGGPQNHTLQFFYPKLSIHYTTFMRLR